jgi:hypothetical protein
VATVTDDAEAAEPQVPTVPLPAETLVMDTETGRQLLRVDGFMPLPAGARIELGSMIDPPATDAIVMKTRVWGASSPKPLLVLDVMLRPPGEDTDLP